MEQSLARLEEKVLLAMRSIQDLRNENARLKGERDALQDRCASLNDDREKLSRELEETRAVAASVERFEEKRRVMEERVGALLEKLEQIG